MTASIDIAAVTIMTSSQRIPDKCIVAGDLAPAGGIGVET
jgi:hypothetical protein